MRRWLRAISVVVILLGLLGPRLRQGPAARRLPGDIAVRWRGRDYFFPFTTTILLSLLFFAISRLL